MLGGLVIAGFVASYQPPLVQPDLVKYPQSLGTLCNSPVISSTWRIAAVAPVFTAQAYAANGFYKFYALHAGSGVGSHITTDFQYLNLKVQNTSATNPASWGNSKELLTWLQSAAAQSCGVAPTLTTDILVGEGGLFSANGSRAFDVAVVAHSEYVTAQEYYQVEHFVATGGKLVVLDGDAFYVQVDYNSTTGMMRYMQGHGYIYNSSGVYATYWPTDNPFARQSKNWFAGTYCCSWRARDYQVLNAPVFSYSNLIAGSVYRFHLNNTEVGSNGIAANQQPLFIDYPYPVGEEDSITNYTATHILFVFAYGIINGEQTCVCAFQHYYRAGSVIDASLYGTRFILSDRDFQWFVVQALE